MLKRISTALILVASLFSTQAVSVESSTPFTLKSECQDILESFAKKLGIKMADLLHSTQPVNAQAMKLKNHIIKIGQWENVRSRCVLESMQNVGCSDCDSCSCSVDQCCYWGACYACNGQGCH